ncbi:MAG: hypothetical protein LBD35_06955 [Prevotellaceae bacterium]|jgi:hypothetical protein|nr:hypothetical protein [Prevotellaceae bacterium]
MKRIVINLICILALITINSCNKEDDALPQIENTIFGLDQVDTSAPGYEYTEYIAGARDPKVYYFWKVSSGTVLAAYQGNYSAFIKLKAPSPGKYRDVTITMELYTNSTKTSKINTITKTVSVK